MTIHYVIKLWKPAASAFCSFDKLYVGIKQDILSVTLDMESDDTESEMAKVIREYYARYQEATYRIAYREILILKSARVIASSKMALPEKTWENLNIWNRPYRMKFDLAEVDQIIIRYEGQYHRCIRAKITDFCYAGIHGERVPVDMIFGNAFVLNAVPHPSGKITFENLLYVQEDISKDKESLILKLNDPNEVVFDRICDEIFGDR